MDYQQFVSEVEIRVKQQVKDRMSVTIQTTMKNNGKHRIGIVMSETGINISPTIYLEEFFEEFKRDRPMECIVKDILQLYQEVRFEQSMDVDSFREFDQMKEKVVYKLIHARENQELLETIPYRLFLEFAVVCYISLDVCEKGVGTVLVTNEMLRLWKISSEELFRIAHQNTQKLLPAKFQTIRSVVMEMLGEENEEFEKGNFMYVLTNEKKSFGAACVLYDHVLDDIGNELGENYYMIPSSVHEFLIIPESHSPGRGDLSSMIREVNTTQVDEEEILSFQPYYYDRRRGCMTI